MLGILRPVVSIGSIKPLDPFTPALSKKYDEEDSDTKKEPALSKKYDVEDSDTKKEPALSKKYDEEDSDTKKEPALSKKYDEEDSDTKKDPSFTLPKSKSDHSYPLMVREECKYTRTPLRLVEQNDFKDELEISAVDMEELKATKPLRPEVKDTTELCEKDAPLETVPNSEITSEGAGKVPGGHSHWK